MKDITREEYKHKFIEDNKDYINSLLNPDRFKNRDLSYEVNGEIEYYTHEDDIVTDYAFKVLTYEIVASLEVIKGCILHLEYLIMEDSKYIFRVHNALKIIKFGEASPNPNNKKENLVLAHYQKWILGNLQGWRTNDEYNEKRYDYALIMMGRRNSKSLIQSIYLSYELIYGDNPQENRVLACAANDFKQASIIYKYCKGILKHLHKIGIREVVERFEEKGGELINKEDGSYLRALTSNLEALDGYEMTTCVCDEVHKYKDSELFDVITSGQKMLDTMTLMITTTGDDPTGFLFSEHQNALKRLDGDIEGVDEWFYFIANLDSEDELNSPICWEKSNPLLGHPDSMITNKLKSTIEKEYKYKYLTGNSKDYIIKTHCLWGTGSEDNLVDINVWDNHEIEKFNRRGQEVYIGVDLSTHHDFTGVTFVYPEVDKDNNVTSYIESMSFIPTPKGLSIDIRMEKDNIRYIDYVNSGDAELAQSSSGVLDHLQVVRYIVEKVTKLDLNVIHIYYDPAKSIKFVEHLEVMSPDLYEKLVETKQDFNNYTSAIACFRQDLLEGRIKHVKNDLLRLSIINTKIKYRDGLYMPDKRKGLTNDSSVAMLMAYKGIVNHLDFSEALVSTYIWDVIFGGKLNT